MSQNSNVEHPAHYNSGNIECIDAMIAAFGKTEVQYFAKSMHSNISGGQKIKENIKKIWRRRLGILIKQMN